ncbi:MAG: 3-hydroxyacyl-ACP dehydratase FabZ [Vampirovibrionales bacterium]|nr:3-hydroxyacyl-ACP dehydratase FabZ [Vampirovibrionales bacterium]
MDAAEIAATDSQDVVLPPLSSVEIMAVIPHRFPLLLIDRVTRHIQGKRIEGYKNLTINDAFFQGHFPGRPIMPGVLQLEALAQLGGVLIQHLPQCKGKLAVFSGIDNVRFRRMVTPGDRLDLMCEVIKLRPPIGRSFCRASVDGQVTVEGELMFSLIEP